MKASKDFWKMYPGSRLSFDVTKSGQHSYRITASLINNDGKIIASIDHYGSNDLKRLKEQAFEILAEELDESATT